VVDLHRSSALSFGVYSFDSRAGRHRLGFTASVALPTVVRGARATDEDSRERLAVRLDPRGSTLAVRLDPRRPARPSRCGSTLAARPSPSGSTLAVRLDPRGSTLAVRLDPRGAARPSLLDPRRPARPSRCGSTLAARPSPSGSTLAVRLDPRGVLYVELGHRSPADAFRRRPAVDGGAVFGASLAGTGDTTPEVTIIGNRSVPKL